MHEQITKALLYSAQRSRNGYRPVVEFYDGTQRQWRKLVGTVVPERDDATAEAHIWCSTFLPVTYVTARTSLNGKRLRRRGNFPAWVATMSAAS